MDQVTSMSSRSPTPTVWRLKLAARDFQDAQKFISHAGGHALHTLEHEALLEVAILRYARPFSGNERGLNPGADSRLTADIADPLKLLRGVALDLHLRIVNLRNPVIAHAESARNPAALSNPIPGDEATHAGAGVSPRWHVVNECIDLTLFAQIARELEQRCLHLLFELTRRL
jgi:hypothetical protein